MSRKRWWTAVATAALVTTTVSAAPASARSGDPLRGVEWQSLDGSGNNKDRPDWGKAATEYPRVAPARYTDGVGAMVGGPSPRYVSNRIFNDAGQQLYSERGLSQWAQVWAQFVTHTVGLRVDGADPLTIPFDTADPLENVTATVPVVPAGRSQVVPGSGVTAPREPLNVNSAYVDAFAVYGGSAQRLEWMREGPVDGDLGNNGARLMMPGNLLPRRDARGDAASAPAVDSPGVRLLEKGVVAGDIRAGENLGLTAVQTLLAREHNRIVDALPSALAEETKFQVARRVVIALEQYITYQEFLPAMGVRLAPYRGYRPAVNPGTGNEFITVGFRAHSMARGDFSVEVAEDRYSPAELDAFRARGLVVVAGGGTVTVTVPPSVAAFNPELVGELGLGPLLQGLTQRPEAKNDELVGDLTRNIRLERPVGCHLPEAGCQVAIFDVSAIDVARGRDHGMPGYNEMRETYGLAPKTTFTSITGERSDAFPSDPELTPGDEINDPDSLDFVRVLDDRGNPVPPGSERAVTGERRTTLAARLKAVYGTTAELDAFTGVFSEPHVPGSELGELQLAMWKRQFEATRDGDRFFYLNDPVLLSIRQRFGIDYQRSLAELIALNTDVGCAQLPHDVFFTGRR
ncbi:peroxidase family protein [Catenuloplanes japonicus]|uniref:peroxidase family protein n=1 Tax=Catenuloplanes japonicus TaxID=33876 RepID=UPI00069082B6|nr:peroxidase family protein [Catenuloplanes japonicus]